MPVKSEEYSRDLFSKKKMNRICEIENDKCKQNFFTILIRSTRFNDVSDLLKSFIGVEIWSKDLSSFFEHLTSIQNFIFHYPLIISFNYFLENFLCKYPAIENYVIIQRLFHFHLLSKKKFQSSDFLIKKLSIKNYRLRKNFSFLIIMNHEKLFARKIFNGIQGYLKWFCLSLEKYFGYNYYQGKLRFSLAKVALVENKRLKAFSLFVESIEEFGKNDFKGKTIVIEWLIFSFILLKKRLPKNRLLGDLISYKSKNLFRIKGIYNAIEKNNIVLLENEIFKSKGNPIIFSSSYLLTKKIFKNIKKKIKKLLSVYIRLSIYQFAIYLGVSRNKTELILSYNTLKGKQKGYFEYITDTYVISFFKMPEIKTNIFIDALINLGCLVTISSEKKQIFFGPEKSFV